jgi:hypothetical protein
VRLGDREPPAAQDCHGTVEAALDLFRRRYTSGCEPVRDPEDRAGVVATALVDERVVVGRSEAVDVEELLPTPGVVLGERLENVLLRH